ncbi:MotE family protein [Algihabitans sp.]|uniref:MotE family protein n=1 Tax=Algihabitans sp. TaxID=2821514 RepID=UPI003BAA700F
MRVRLLPLVIAVAVVTLGFRLEAVREGVTAVAQETPPAAAPTDPFPPLDANQLEEAPSEASDALSEDLPDGTASVDTELDSEALLSALPTDPFALTDSEIELLQALSERRAELQKREAELETREALLTAAEARIEQKITELEQLQVTIEDLLVDHDEQEQAQLDSLVKIYEAMKPKDAARIFEELEMTVLLNVVENMKERKTAPILAEMNPTKAKAVTLELAQRRDLPIPRE